MHKMRMEQMLMQLGQGNRAPVTLIPLSQAPEISRESGKSKRRFIVLSEGIPLDELSTDLIDVARTETVVETLERSRIVSLLGLSSEIGLIKFDRPLTLEDVLVLLKWDGEGIVGYSSNFRFEYYLDYDKTGYTVEMEFRSSCLN